MSQDILLTDKIAVIVGGVPEVAEATARVMATHGAAGLMICGRGAERGQALAAIISAAGCPTHFLVLIVGAGEVPYLPLEDTTPEKLDQLLAAKVRAPFLVLQGALALMQRTGGIEGTVIVTIGGTGAEGPRTVAAAAGRGALAAMAQGFATTVAGDRIRVFGLAIDDERTGSCATPQAVARAIADLAAGTSSAAPGSITFAPGTIASTCLSSDTARAARSQPAAAGIA